ncbi:MAG: undecaprenyl-diphosphate phosphatase [Nannocystaceae bacterium]|nr:undecaprenyl-diphosphate phosphatase [Nannocystaceae bacterium]
MKQGHQHQREAAGREHGPLSTSPGAHAGATEPRGSLHRRHPTQDSSKDSRHTHRGQGIALALFVVLSLVSTAVWASAPTSGGNELTVWFAILLGAIQGATEFLPVSSSGHLSLGQAWLGIDPESAGHRFNIVLHAGTLIAVLWVYRQDVRKLLGVLVRPMQDTPDRRRLLRMLLASLPLGIALIPAVEDLVIAMESHVRLVGVALLVTAAILFAAFRPGRGEGETTDEPPSAKQAILIGIAQVFAVLPGISRSGSTIAAGLVVGLDRPRAARFSFLISLIAVGGATAKEVLDILGDSASAESIAIVPFAAGFVASLIVGLLSLRGLLYLVGRGRMLGFVIYLIVMGGVAIAVG